MCIIIRGLLDDQQQLATIMASEHHGPSSISQFIDAAKAFGAGVRKQSPYAQLLHCKRSFTRVTIGMTEITVSFDCRKLAGLILHHEDDGVSTEEGNTPQAPHTITLPMRIGRRGRETRLILHNPGSQGRPVDRSLIAIIARGYAWRQQIVTGEVASVAEIAKRENITDGYVSRLIDLGFLAPDIIAAILNGTAPVDLTANRLQVVRNLPLDWPSQRQVLSFAAT